MKKVKDFLQNLGIIYINWKQDNIGNAKTVIINCLIFMVHE
jgi:hypothetical protein